MGPPGVGKTRLALAVADEIQGEFADGALFIDLTPVRD
ncbi:MAG: AAA family ATPase, partial [Nitrospiraceae bacterium]